MTTWLIHGFNVSDGGRRTVCKLAPHLSGDVQMLRYGWTGLIGLKWANERAVDKLLKRIRPGDNIVAHSNGCLIAWYIAQRVKLGRVVCMNPALRRDAEWPEGLPVLCLHNSTDWVVQLGRIWGRLFPVDGIKAQGWGAAGRYGFTVPNEKLVNFDMAEGWWVYPVKGHSGQFEQPAAAYWAEIVDKWLQA